MLMIGCPPRRKAVWPDFLPIYIEFVNAKGCTIRICLDDLVIHVKLTAQIHCAGALGILRRFAGNKRSRPRLRKRRYKTHRLTPWRDFSVLCPDADLCMVFFRRLQYPCRHCMPARRTILYPPGIKNRFLSRNIGHSQPIGCLITSTFVAVELPSDLRLHFYAHSSSLLVDNVS